MAEPRSTLPLAAHPSVLVGLAVQRWGEREFVARCVALLRSMSWEDDPDLLLHLGGRPGLAIVERGVGRQAYWLRVWPLRAMLYAWDGSAEPAVVDALSDEHWRVREMAAKVVAHRRLGAAAEALGPLFDDPVPRVRSAATRALDRLSTP